jgi:hypothetical protein
MDIKSVLANALLGSQFKVVTPYEVMKIVRPTNEPLSVDTNSTMTVQIPQQELESSIPAAAPIQDSDIPPTDCSHLCDCGKWWSHGSYDKCRYPTVLKQGLCPDCLNGRSGPNKPGLDHSISLSSGTLTVAEQIEQRNKARMQVANMNYEQRSHHILFLAKLIEELRVQSLETSKINREEEDRLIEEAGITSPSERAKFIDALRSGNKPSKASKPKKDKPATGKTKEAELIASLQSKHPLAMAKVIAGMMIKTGKTQAQVEAWLND